MSVFLTGARARIAPAWLRFVVYCGTASELGDRLSTRSQPTDKEAGSSRSKIHP